MSVRDDIDRSLKESLKAQDKRRISTLRLVHAALKDRDIALRGEGRSDGMTEPEILELLGRMVRQRHDSIKDYEKAKRDDLVKQEREEIDIITDFMPPQLEPDEVIEACNDVIKDLGAEGLKDMGRVMTELKSRYSGRMDFSKTGRLVRETLTQQQSSA